MQTLKYKLAIADFRKLLTLEPQNQLVRTQLDSTTKIMRKVEFEKVRVPWTISWACLTGYRP